MHGEIPRISVDVLLSPFFDPFTSRVLAGIFRRVGFSMESHSENHRSFLIKVNSDDAPNRLGMPKKASEWEDGFFETGPPLKRRDGHDFPMEQRQKPRIGDNLYIWINVTKKKLPPGKSLTAIAEVASDPMPSQGKKIRVQVKNVRLYDPPGIINDSHLRGVSGGVLKEIARLRKTSLRCLSSVHARELEDAIRRRGGTLTPTHGLSTIPPLPSIPTTLPASNSKELLDEHERILRLIEQRQNQGPFRKAVMARDGRCAVTRCRTAEVLEAAHLIPYASNDPERDKIENGILLRADIHTLLDRHLVAINPDTMSLWVSSRLHETAYAGLNGKKIRTGAGLERLRHQYEAAMRRDRGEPPYG
jgi:hypothetical protein